MSDWWRWDGWPTPGEWQAFGAVATTIVAGVAAWIALSQLKAHHEAQREQSRPYVIVDFAFRSMLISIEVRNIGQTPATDVRMAWNVEPRAVEDRQTAAITRNLVDRSIPFLAPGRAVRYSIGWGPKFVPDDSLPKRYEVTTTYGDGHGHAFGPELQILDFDQWAESSVDVDYDNKNWNEFKRQTEAQQKIADNLGRLDDRAEGLLASFAQTAVQMLTASRVGSQDAVAWAVIPHSSQGRLVANIGTEVARDVEVAEIGGASDFLQICDDSLPRDVRVGDAVELSLFSGLGQPTSTRIRVTWTEAGRTRQAYYTVGLGR
ncbi:hypothetical protein [uncultured Aeromicrobium sp.]|uniref:hypothetical protein n=1 Tax=uncultured Aeromicrobium sp. TaxID=337820 RepID=UPI0025F9695B|nr:hypothetical protein [uncultured Aeromicrobium sp.]